MKTLSGVKTTVTGDKITITADIVEREFRFPVQQVTVGYLNPANIRWPRHIQLSNDACFVKAFGNGFAISTDDLVKIASQVEPKTSFPPLFGLKMPNYTVEISSELHPDLQWEVSDKLTGEWSKVEGQTSATLDKSKVKTGQFVRCVASSDAGSVTSNPAIVK